MMPLIKLQNVSVSFPIYSASNRSLKNRMMAATTGGRIGLRENRQLLVQALDNVSLEIEHGDKVALVGHNGAGKTTLLRVLAGIYEPAVGQIAVNGSVTPLFDVTIGIDPECTGYENIILRGLYMGLTKPDVLERLPEVAEFTELGDFLDLPVRTYSAGMQARLAFAMATCIEPEILLLDEGIGAGDAGFLVKANERLDTFIHKAGILVFASHSQDLIRRLCNKIILMEHGRIVWRGEINEGLKVYAGMVAGGAPPQPSVA
jgi:ABC-type polysaccharide/polyol phosphate transport system ATPase subunit